MPFVTVDREGSADIDLYYADRGRGQSLVLVPGLPTCGQAWVRRLAPLLAAGYRIVTYDRRGCGRSARPTFGYDLDTFAADLNILLEVLDVTDAVLVGFCTGTGEVGRYLGTYGPARVSKALFVTCLEAFPSRADDHPHGVDGADAAKIADYDIAVVIVQGIDAKAIDRELLAFLADQ